MATATPDVVPDAEDAAGQNTNGVRRRRSYANARYIVARVIRAFFTIFVVASATFFLVRVLPGNPVQAHIDKLMHTQSMTYEQALAQAQALFSFDPDEPLVKQYFDYLMALLKGDLGVSFKNPGVPVSTLIAEYLPWTVFCVGIALIIAFLLGIGLGMAMAYRRNGPFDHVMTFFASLTHSIPNYLLATIIIVFVGVQMGMFKVAELRGSISEGVEVGFNLEFFQDAFYHAGLPIFVYILTSLGGWMLLMKSSTIETLGEDYVTVARARGLKDGTIQTQYVGRNAMLPLFTSFILSMGFIFGGAILVEKVTQYRGVGDLLLRAIEGRDYPVMQGILLVVTAAVVVANLAADLLYSKVDPRIRIKGQEG